MKNLFKIVGYNLGLILVLAFIAEMIFGNWIYGSDFGMLNIPRNIKKIRNTSQFSLEKDAIYTRDKFGFRGEYGGDPANIDVAVIGGSTTNERFITDDETWVHVLGDKLSKKGINIRIVNSGVEGQSTVGHIYIFDAWFSEIPSFQPKFFIAYIGINDIEVDAKQNFLLSHAKYDKMEYTELSRRIRQYTLNHSALYRLYKTATGYIKARRAKITHRAVIIPESIWSAARFPEQAFIRKEAELKRHLDAYEERVAILIDRIRHWGSKAVIVTQSGAGWRIRNGQVYGRGEDGAITGEYVPMTLFNRRAMKACQRKKAICIDLAAKLEFQNSDFYDKVHTTPAGSARIAAFMAKELAPHYSK